MKRLLRSLGSALAAFLFVGFVAVDRLTAADKLPVVVKITVPADAVLEIDGEKKTQTGTDRSFITPDLEKGKKYNYQLKATFKKEGKPVTVEKTISVEPGKDTEIDLTKADEPKAAPVLVKLTVPADAVVEIDGVKSKQTGADRSFQTPDLEKGRTYTYQLKATFTKAGKPVVVEKTLSLEPGKDTELDLTKEETAKLDEPKEIVKKDEPKREESKKEVAKKDEPKKEETKKEVAKKDEPKEEPKKEVRLDVPYVPTPETVVEAMLKLGSVTDQDVVYDLGCGDGRIVITAVKKYKAKKGVGIELFPDRVKLSKENAKKEGVSDKVEIREGSVLDLTDVSEASVVTLYLLPNINEQLMPMLKKTLKPGSRIVSHDFKMGDWKAEKEITTKGDGREHIIYLWTIPGETKPIEVKKEEPKKEIVKKEEPKKEEPKKEIVKKDEPKKEEPKKEIVKKEEKTIVVPYVPTPQKVVDEMLKMANVKPGEIIYDLGCGDGRILVTAAQKYKASGWGLDLNPERIKDSEMNAKKAKVDNRLAFAQGDVLKLKDVSEANVVTLYLLPEVNRRLAPVLQKTLKPGSRVVSHDFDMGDWKEDKKIDVVDETGTSHTIYLWTIK